MKIHVYGNSGNVVSICWWWLLFCGCYLQTPVIWKMTFCCELCDSVITVFGNHIDIWIYDLKTIVRLIELIILCFMTKSWIWKWLLLFCVWIYNIYMWQHKQKIFKTYRSLYILLLLQMVLYIYIYVYIAWFYKQSLSIKHRYMTGRK